MPDPAAQPGGTEPKGATEPNTATPGAPGATSIAIQDLHGRDAYRLLTSLVIPRPIAWISTIAADGTPNLAPYSFFNLVAGRPLTVMFSAGQHAARRGAAARSPKNQTATNQGAARQPKDTLANAQETGEFVVNFANRTLAALLNQTSATDLPNVNEFHAYGVTPAPSTDVVPPRVKDAVAALEARVTQIVPIEGSRSTIVLGQVLRVHLNMKLLAADGLVDPHQLAPVARLGRDQYAALGEVFSLTRPD